MPTKKIKVTTSVSIEGTEYLTFPQALTFIGIERGLLHQRIMRDAGKNEGDENAINAINIEKYVFVPRSYCERMKTEIENEASAGTNRIAFKEKASRKEKIKSNKKRVYKRNHSQVSLFYR